MIEKMKKKTVSGTNEIFYYSIINSSNFFLSMQCTVCISPLHYIYHLVYETYCGFKCKLQISNSLEFKNLEIWHWRLKNNQFQTNCYVSKVMNLLIQEIKKTRKIKLLPELSNPVEAKSVMLKIFRWNNLLQFQKLYIKVCSLVWYL